MNDMYTIVHNKDVSVGQQCPVVGEFDTMDDVMHHYDKVLMVDDPEGVEAGDYHIDGDEDE
jgi:hypothetical protein